MRRLLSALIVSAVLVTASGCSAEVDWADAEAQANAFIGAEYDGLGIASLRLADVSADEGGSVTLEFSERGTVTGVDVACFGDGRARFAYTAETESGSVGAEAEVRCDGSVLAVVPQDVIRGVGSVTVTGTLVSGGGGFLVARVLGEVE
ncbi:hypothetical protein [Microbacterium sp. GXF6406]